MLNRTSVNSVDENTPLLSVVVESGKEREKKSSTEPYLLDEIRACIGMFNVTALIAAPAITLTTALKLGGWLYEKLLPEWQEQINVLNRTINNITQSENGLQSLYDQLRNKAEPWLDQYMLQGG